MPKNLMLTEPQLAAVRESFEYVGRDFLFKEPTPELLRDFERKLTAFHKQFGVESSTKATAIERGFTFITIVKESDGTVRTFDGEVAESGEPATS